MLEWDDDEVLTWLRCAAKCAKEVIISAKSEFLLNASLTYID